MMIGLDSNVLISALSPKERHSDKAQQLIRAINSGRHQAIATSIVYGEVLTVSSGSQSLDLEDFFSHIDNFTTVAADDRICLKAGELRLEYGSKLKLPDALHIATALLSNAKLFITNDEVLAKVAKELIPVKLLSQWV